MPGKIVANFIGIVSYRISKDNPNAFLATYYSNRTDGSALGSGFARGDTSNGFCGVHEIRYYEPSGASPSVAYELTITREGEVRNMVWKHEGKVIFIGFGIETGDQLIATYWHPSK